MLGKTVTQIKFSGQLMVMASFAVSAI